MGAFADRAWELMTDERGEVGGMISNAVEKELGERRRVDVSVEEDRRRRVDGAQRAEDVGVLPAGLGRRRDVPVRRARRVQVHRPEGGDAQRVVAARLQPRTALADRLSRASGLELGTLDDVSRVIVRDGDDEGGAAALAGCEHGGHRPLRLEDRKSVV